MIRSILAVVAGILVLSAISFGIEAAVGGGNKWLMSAYTLLSIAAGGYVTALIATRSPVRHAVVMGAVETAFTIPVMFVMSDHLPLWGWIASIALITPAAWSGGALAEHNQIRRHR